MTTDGLREQIEDFAERVNATLRGVLGDLVEPLEATALGGSFFVVETSADVGLTLTKDGEPFLALKVRFECGWDGPETYTRVNRSEFHLMRHGEPRPLIRYEFTQKAHRHRPIAHVHVHTDDERLHDVMAVAGASTRTGKKHARRAEKGKAQHADLHLPVGGPRFRPALEDVLHMAVEEFGIDAEPGWVERLEAGREVWRRIQTRAVSRDAPEEAAEALEAMGYDRSTAPQADILRPTLCSQTSVSGSRSPVWQGRTSVGGSYGSCSMRCFDITHEPARPSAWTAAPSLSAPRF